MSTTSMRVVPRLLLLALLALMSSCKHPWCERPKVEIRLFDPAGPKERPIQAPEVGDSLSIGLVGLEPGEQVDIRLTDDTGAEWSYARLFADREGRIAPQVFWYHTGVIGRTTRLVEFVPNPAFETFEEAERYFARHPLELVVRNESGLVLGRRVFRVAPRTGPMLYPSDSDGILMNAIDVASGDVFVTGSNFPAGSTVHLYGVPNQFSWSVGDAITDVTGKQGEAAIETLHLAADQTSFTARLFEEPGLRPGAFDLIARIGGERDPLRLGARDVLAYNDDTALVLYMIINGNIVIESAGRMRGAPAKFEFSDGFEKGEDVHAAVDPSDVPAVHSGGNYAAYYVVDDQDPAYWDGTTPALTDVSGGIEIQRVKYWCINMSRRMIWAAATQPSPIRGYDVVVDFGATPANNAADFVADGFYTKGTDFVDGYDDAGFYVLEDPGAVGAHAVGQVVLDDPNGISGITDPTGATGPTYDVTLAWGKLMYPADSSGVGVPLSTTEPRYPVALFLHGRHVSCDSNGSAPGGTGSMASDSCPAQNRVPSHEGYDYILERLASQGIIAVSISAHQIQFDNGFWNYDARGRLVLKWLDKLRDWSDNGTDPFGGIFTGRIDMSRVALSGHSRGGEGVVAAEDLNRTWPSPHSILAVNAIAPTDQHSGPSFVARRAAYFLILGARDGDVSNMQGLRTYDREYPQQAVERHPKVLATLYGANHNYFNTVWTDAAALGQPNGWAGAVDDGASVSANLMPAADQRGVALTTIAAFFRMHLQALPAYKEILTGRLEPAALPNADVFWAYQDANRLALDDFEQMPTNASQNSLGGAATHDGFSTFAETHFNSSSTDYSAAPPRDGQFFHDTIGLRLGWSTPKTLITRLPAGQRDVSGFTHLTLRAAKRVSGAATTGPGVNLFVNIEDGSGNSALWDLRTNQFDPIPHPYLRNWSSNQSLLTGVRIPLRNFTMNNSGVDLTDIVEVRVRTEGAGELGIDDIEFGN